MKLFNSLVLVVVSLLFVCNVVESQTYQTIQFNPKVDCSNTCDYFDASNWLGGVVPQSSNQKALITLQSTSRPQKVSVSNDLVVGAIDINNAYIALNANLKTNVLTVNNSQLVAVGDIYIGSGGFFYSDLMLSANVVYNAETSTFENSIISLDTATNLVTGAESSFTNCQIHSANDVQTITNAPVIILSGPTNNMNGVTIVSSSTIHLFVQGDASFYQSSVYLVDVFVQGTLVVAEESNMQTSGNVTVLGSMWVEDISTFEATTNSLLVDSNSTVTVIFNNLVSTSGVTFSLTEIYLTVFNQSQVLGELSATSCSYLDIFNSTFQNLILQGYTSTAVYQTLSSVNNIEALNASSPIYFEYQGYNNLDGSSASSDYYLGVILLNSSVLELSGVNTIQGDSSSISLFENATLSMNNIALTVPIIMSAYNGSTITATNGEITSSILLQEANVVLGGIQITGDVYLTNCNVTSSDNVFIRGNYMANTDSQWNINYPYDLPTNSQSSIITVTGQFVGSLSLGLVSSNGTPSGIPTVVANTPYYILSSSESIPSFGYTFSTPSVTTLTPHFEVVYQYYTYYLTVTFKNN
ncbi:hypothetical protein DFA_11119 [Cavenderia fasciculata]|uniref:Uncharacterized protein n=1 Tax=Cavenderia fasciculata TaxID=261658 RepID=F4QEZ9_CACFS|nr:uncharacterized protein DFA_11119 [Cavenderia fasciculata]EGG13358.1 hypothetical protein DFA_11119 [Cavenderia fasciculata]|eukprot:XP_004350062.1 hypothetical protein DFA_11119 [Cavenderia fasciculata]